MGEIIHKEQFFLEKIAQNELERLLREVEKEKQEKKDDKTEE